MGEFHYNIEYVDFTSENFLVGWYEAIPEIRDVIWINDKTDAEELDWAIKKVKYKIRLRLFDLRALLSKVEL